MTESLLHNGAEDIL